MLRLADKLDIEATIRTLERKEKRVNSHDLKKDSSHDSGEVQSNVNQFDLQNELDSAYDNQEKYGNRNYREFNLRQLIPHQFPEYENNSIKLNCYEMHLIII